MNYHYYSGRRVLPELFINLVRTNPAGSAGRSGRRRGKIKREVDASGVTLMQILLTHGHLDHVGAAVNWRSITAFLLSVRKKKMSSGCRTAARKAACLVWMKVSAADAPDRWLNDGDRVSVRCDVTGTLSGTPRRDA